jgi:hypothetical protein
MARDSIKDSLLQISLHVKKTAGRFLQRVAGRAASPETMVTTNTVFSQSEVIFREGERNENRRC